MKKLRYIVMSMFLVCFAAVLLLCACGKGGTSAGDLVMDKMYFSNASENGRQNYFIFHSDGTGEYSRYYIPTPPYIQHYVVRFKYFYADKDGNSVACFFDGVEYSGDHKGADVYDDTVYLLTVTEHIIISSMGNFINEDDLDKLPKYDMTEV